MPMPFAGHQRQRQIGVRIVARDQPIDPVLVKKSGQLFDLAAIQNSCIFVVELLDKPTQIAQKAEVDGWRAAHGFDAFCIRIPSLRDSADTSSGLHDR